MTLTTQNPQRNTVLMPQAQELSQIIEISKALASSAFYQKIGAPGVLAIWLTARELNLPPMMCLNGGLYTFDGKVTMSAQLMNMMIVNAGHRADVLHLDDKLCKIRFWRCDRQKGIGDTFVYDFGIEQAAKAGYLSKDNWKKSPKDMLFSRCLSGGARKFMPDVLMNCYVFGEIEDKNFSDAHLDNVMPNIALEPITFDESTQITDQLTASNKPKVITSEQVTELVDLLANTTKEYSDSVYATLKKFNPPINGLVDLPSTLFERIRDAAIKNQIKPQSVMQEDFKDEGTYEES